MALMQINKKVTFAFGMPKAELKQLADDHNKSLDFWEIVDVDVVGLASILSQGTTIRPGIKENGNKKENVTSIQWLAIDFDETTVDEVLSVPFSKNACLWYYTPSYQPGVNEKCRLVFKLDKLIDQSNIMDYEKIYGFMMLQYGKLKPDNCASRGHLFFGAYNNPGGEEDYVHILDEDATLPVDIILEACLDAGSDTQESVGKSKESLPTSKPTSSNKKSKKTPDSIESGESMTTKILKHIKTHIFDDVCNGDVSKFFWLWNHKLRSLSTDDKRQAQKYEGRLHGSNNPKGSGLVVVVNDDSELPPLYIDRSDNGNTWNYIEYWFNVRQMITGGAAFKPELKNCFSKVVNDITTHFGVEEFDFKANSSFTAKIKTHIQEDHIINLRGWDLDKDIKYLYFDEEVKFWKYISPINLVNVYISPRFKDDNPDWQQELAEYAASLGIKKVPDIKTLIKGILVNNNPKMVHEYPESERHLIPMKNGVFNIESGELEKNTGQAYNFSRPLNMNYERVSDDHPVIQNLTTYFHKWVGDEKQANLLLSYLILCVKREAYRMRKMLMLMGTSTKGKSTYGSLVQNIMNGKGTKPESMIATKMDIGGLCSGGDHNTAAIEGKYLIYIDEVNTLNPAKHDLENLKKIVAEEHDRTFNINPKFEKQRTITSYTSLIGTSEDILKVGTSDGLDRRFVYVQVDENTNMTLTKELFQLKENTEIIHNWCLTQDTDYHLNLFLETSEDEKIQSNLVDKKRMSEPLCEFFDVNLEITDNENDTVDTNLIWYLWDKYKKQYGCEYNFKSKQSFGQRFSKVISDKKYGINWKSKGGQRIQASGKTIPGKYTHMKVLNRDVFEEYALELESKGIR